MKPLATKLFLASMMLSMLIGAETAYAYSNVVAGDHPLPDPEIASHSAGGAATWKVFRTTHQPHHRWRTHG
jgi:hypothetical protein